MKVCIIGGYGGESIGDRASLAGILAFLSELHGELDVQLGSLEPFYSERTVREDQSLWEKLIPGRIKVDLFNSTVLGELKASIAGAELLLLGGGMLADWRGMHMLSFAFRFARKRRVRSGLLGCGLGRLSGAAYRQAAMDVLSNVDFAVFRDSRSEEAARALSPDSGAVYCSASDPATYCAVLFKAVCPLVEVGKMVSINLADGCPGLSAEMVEAIMDGNEGNKAVLVPMGYFPPTRDDRAFMNAIRYRLGRRELSVQNRPLSLEETMRLFASSSSFFGMNYHAVMLMSLLNGKGRILNASSGCASDIRDFLKIVDPSGFWGPERMFSLEQGKPDRSFFLRVINDEVFEPAYDRLEHGFESYRAVIAPSE
ncbi:hypothetical protein PDESU_04180 [Pontiella desulfatans]|uniref:Polysaccharide pyruvyl transferase domain-containing protein n=1 Tax=Pontiella desulfatans TaxID=2750659 RepID=A0A6C2U6P0_PONDE|nr:polysaccharide pyruvyl transferase family protein [Pontiella desulfatans]VGO15595.1 hypothetical protein PDESU_04180 [Pontiella desulfatans]